jgi:hypothetical protein
VSGGRGPPIGWYATVRAQHFAQAEDAVCADLPRFLNDEFNPLLECSILARGFLRLLCADCGHDKLGALSCIRRGFCSSCGPGTRRRTG